VRDSFGENQSIAAVLMAHQDILDNSLISWLILGDRGVELLNRRFLIPNCALRVSFSSRKEWFSASNARYFSSNSLAFTLAAL
jgi:hypothetical protein